MVEWTSGVSGSRSGLADRAPIAGPRSPPAVLAVAGAGEVLVVRRARRGRGIESPAALAQRTIRSTPVTSSLTQAAWLVAYPSSQGLIASQTPARSVR